MSCIIAYFSEEDEKINNVICTIQPSIIILSYNNCNKSKFSPKHIEVVMAAYYMTINVSKKFRCFLQI